MSAHTEIISTPHELSSLMNRKNIRLAAKKLQQDNQASHQGLLDCCDNLEHQRGLLGQPAVAFLPPTV